jgi:ParB family chromosome partitioning protein
MPTATLDAKHDTKHDPKRRALGKGLESLLPSRPTAIPHLAASAESLGKPMDIPLDQIDRNPFQTRTHFDEEQLKELAQSIIASGVVQPIVVRRLTDGRYQLITGERRWLASGKAGKATVPAIIRQASDEQAMEITIIENLQRADLNPMEQARAFHRLSSEFHLTQEQMSICTGKERTSIANFLRLLKLPESVQEKVESGALSFGHARTLLALDSPETIASAAKKILALSLSVRQTETYIQGLINPESKKKEEKKAIQAEDPNVREAQEQLQRKLGLRVRIEDRRGKGRVIIEYANVEDFDAIVAALGE